MDSKSTLKLLAVFVLTLSLAALPSVIPSARATVTPPSGTTLLTQWWPAGPAADQIQYSFYTDEPTEFVHACLGQPSTCVPDIDLTDTALLSTADKANCANNVGVAFWCTPPSPEFGMFQIDVNWANTFWGVPFNKGADNSPTLTKAININQAVASLVDKATFATNVVNGFALDNQVAPAQCVQHSALPSAPPGCAGVGSLGGVGPYCVDATTDAVSNPPCTSGQYPIGGACSWDTVLGCSQTPLSAEHYNHDTTTANGIVTPPTAGGTPATNDFCLAAQHLVAAGLATGINSGTDCSVIGWSGTGTIQFGYRQDNPFRNALGTGLIAALCQLIHGAATTSCAEVTPYPQTIATAGGNIFRTGCALVGGVLPAGCATNGPNLNWNYYTGGFLLGPGAPNQAFGLYTSNLASNYCGGSPGEQSSNYDYFCSAKTDVWLDASEFDSTPAQAIAALQVGMDFMGNHTTVISIYARSNQYLYLQGWTGVSNANGIGISTGNTEALLNAWNPSPAVAGPTIRWGQKQGTSFLNPYLYSTVIEADINTNIYDALLLLNPYNPSQVISYMGNSYSTVAAGGDGGACPTSVTRHGTAFPVGGCIKINLRGDISWQDVFNCGSSPTAACLTAHEVTAQDVKFSYASYNATAGLITGATGNTVDVVYNPAVLPKDAFSAFGGTQAPGQNENIYIALKTLNAWALFDIAGVPIVPQHIWHNSTAAPGAPCLTLDTPACQVESSHLSGPNSDPVTTLIPDVAAGGISEGLLVGSGPWVCASGTLGASGTVIGGQCTFTSTGGPGTQSIPVGGSATLRRFGAGTNQNFAYFRSNGDFKNFQWAANGGSSVGVSQLVSALSCTKIAPPYTTSPCNHWSSPASGLTVTSAGPNVGSVGGGKGTTITLIGINGLLMLSQVARWNTKTWTSPLAYTALTGDQPAPQTIYEDGTQESPPPPPP